MRILHVIAGSERGGAETFCLDAIVALSNAGVSQCVIGRPYPHILQILREHNIPFSGLNFSIKDRLSGKAKKLIKKTTDEFQPDVIHAWMGRAASFIPQNIDVPVLGWFGGYYDLKRHKNCDFYMGVTKDIVRHIVEKSGKPHRTFLVHTFGTLKEEPPVNRSSLSTPAQAPVVLMLSRMHWKKGVDTLLQAAASLPGVYFWLAGDGPELNKYKALAQKLGVSERVKFLGWRTDRAALLGAADLCVLPSRYEPFGTVIAEAWHSGVPLVATRAAGAKQYVQDQVNGLLCDIDAPDQLASQIKRGLNDNELRAALIKNGREIYEEQFSRTIVTKQLIAAYYSIQKTGKEVIRLKFENTETMEYSEIAGLEDCLAAARERQKSDLIGAKKAAAAHALYHEDSSLALDAAHLQYNKFYNFLLRGRCEIWNEREFNIALSNFRYISND